MNQASTKMTSPANTSAHSHEMGVCLKTLELSPGVYTVANTLSINSIQNTIAWVESLRPSTRTAIAEIE